MSTENKYYEDHYGQLVGMVITSVSIIDDGDGKWPRFIGKNSLGETIEVTVSSDQEGNEPGHLFIEKS
jgi:hypothetical protein